VKTIAFLRPAALLMPSLLPALLACTAIPALAAEMSKDEAATVHINAIKNPELHTYRAVVAGLDKFDELHALAPAVPQLRFQVEARRGKGLDGEPLAARIAADDFSIPLVLDQDLRFSVPRSEAAYEAKAEMILNRKKREARFNTYVRTPGLADNQYRLGDVRLDCQVKIAIAKEEIPFWANGLVNTVLLTTDWCSWFKGETPKGGDRVWSYDASARLSAATLRDGERSKTLKVEGKTFRLPIADGSWSNDAIVEVEYAPPEPAAPAAPAQEAKENAP
jgi:YD repeat-containing protein